MRRGKRGELHPSLIDLLACVGLAIDGGYGRSDGSDDDDDGRAFGSFVLSTNCYSVITGTVLAGGELAGPSDEAVFITSSCKAG
jgi:hypothetical protein